MKKFNLFIITLLILFCFPTINVNAQTTYIKVGLSKSKNVNNIHIDNQDVLIGYGSGSEFIQKASLTSNYGFDIKTLGNYYIKLSNSFLTYDEALNFSNSSQSNMFPLLENDTWKIYINGFNSVLDAQEYIKKNNTLGEVANLQNVIGVYSKDKLLMGYCGSSPFQFKNNTSRLSINESLYRNVIQINISGNNLSAINLIDIDEYLYGVVPSEMPSSWHTEALKAQAVAARNYAYSNLGLHSSEGFDVCDTVHCQVYNGITSEKDSTNKAIDDTKGIFAYYKGERINAVYSSSNGGYSENSENVWDNRVEYLRAIKDTNEEGGKVWERSFTFDELTNLASNIGNVNEVILENSNVTGRVISLTLVGDNGKKVLTKEEIRTFFAKSPSGSLESRNFVIKNANSQTTNNFQNINQLYVADKGRLYQLDFQNSYSISSSQISKKNNSQTLIDKNQNVVSINNLTNTSNQNNISSETTSIKRSSSSSVTFSGRGWGHGVGMSQYGANSLANKGYKYDEILKYYYTGIDVR